MFKHKRLKGSNMPKSTSSIPIHNEQSLTDTKLSMSIAPTPMHSIKDYTEYLQDEVHREYTDLFTHPTSKEKLYNEVPTKDIESVPTHKNLEKETALSKDTAIRELKSGLHQLNYPKLLSMGILGAVGSFILLSFNIYQTVHTPPSTQLITHSSSIIATETQEPPIVTSITEKPKPESIRVKEKETEKVQDGQNHSKMIYYLDSVKLIVPERHTPKEKTTERVSEKVKVVSPSPDTAKVPIIESEPNEVAKVQESANEPLQSAIVRYTMQDNPIRPSIYKARQLPSGKLSIMTAEYDTETVERVDMVSSSLTEKVNLYNTTQDTAKEESFLTGTFSVDTNSPSTLFYKLTERDSSAMDDDYLHKIITAVQVSFPQVRELHIEGLEGEIQTIHLSEYQIYIYYDNAGELVAESLENAKPENDTLEMPSEKEDVLMHVSKIFSEIIPLSSLSEQPHESLLNFPTTYSINYEQATNTYVLQFSRELNFKEEPVDLQGFLYLLDMAQLAIGIYDKDANVMVGNVSDVELPGIPLTENLSAIKYIGKNTYK